VHQLAKLTRLQLIARLSELRPADRRRSGGDLAVPATTESMIDQIITLERKEETHDLPPDG
jgi:hypothetical protein